MTWLGNESTTNQTTNNISPAAAGQSGEGHVASVNSEGNVSVSQFVTDGGLVDGSIELADLAFEFVGESNREDNLLIRDALNAGGSFVTDISQRAFDLARDSIFSVKSSASAAAAASQQATQESLDFGRDALFVVSDANKANVDLTISALDFADDLNSANLDFLDRRAGEFVTVIEDLDESRSIQSENTLNTVAELAQVVQTGGESLQYSVNKALGVAAILMVGVVAWASVRAS